VLMLREPDGIAADSAPVMPFEHNAPITTAHDKSSRSAGGGT